MLGLALALLVRSLPIEWAAPADCASEAEFRDRVLAQADATESSLSVRVRVREDADGRWRLALAIGEDQRELEGETCEAVIEAAALIVSLRIVEEREAIVPEPEGESGSASESASASASESESESASASDSASGSGSGSGSGSASGSESGSASALGGFLSLAAGPAIGVLPIGAGLSLEGGLQGRAWRVGLSARGFPIARVDAPRSIPGVRGRFDLVVAGVLGCGVPSYRRVLFPICGRVEVGAMRGVGEGNVTTPEPGWTRWAGAALSAAVAWRIVRQVAPFVAVEGVVAFNQPAFSVGGFADPLFTAGRGGFRAFVGLELHFGPASRGEEIGPRNPS